MIALVVPGSPADLADMRVGDVVLSIDGKSTPTGCADVYLPGRHIYSLKRKSLSINVVVHTFGSEEFLARIWGPSVTRVANSLETVPLISNTLFVSGAAGRLSPAGMVITSVLAGSAADSAGLGIGDRIISVENAENGTPLKPELLFGADERLALIVRIGRPGSNALLKRITLEGTSQVILRGFRLIDLHSSI